MENSNALAPADFVTLDFGASLDRSTSTFFPRLDSTMTIWF